jgi:hypothetical protein
MLVAGRGWGPVGKINCPPYPSPRTLRIPGQERAGLVKSRREECGGGGGGGGVNGMVVVVVAAATAVVVGLLCCYVFRPRDAGEDEPATARHVCFIAEILVVVRGYLEHRPNSHLETE